MSTADPIPPAHIHLQGDVPQPMICPVCTQVVTLEQIGQRQALLLWAAGAGVVAFHCWHLSSPVLADQSHCISELGKAVLDLVCKAGPAVDPRGGGG